MPIISIHNNFLRGGHAHNDYRLAASAEAAALCADQYASNFDEQMSNTDMDILEQRLADFYKQWAPDLVDRVPMILDAYREWPLLLFPDIDAVYNTHESLAIEQRVWEKEPSKRREIRVKVAQDYIYLHMHSESHMHKHEKPLQSKARMAYKYGSNGITAACDAADRSSIPIRKSQRIRSKYQLLTNKLQAAKGKIRQTAGGVMQRRRERLEARANKQSYGSGGMKLAPPSIIEGIVCPQQP